ncbi:MAG: DUF1838 domain-containing protein [Phormidesmis sp.]
MGHIEKFEAKDWVKVRNSTKGESVFLTWTGAIYALIPNQAKVHLFNMVGMNVSRSVNQGDRSWDFASRELTYYLDPETDEILHRWENPWSGETLTVMHVANNPVQGRFKGEFSAKVEGDFTTFGFDLFSHYENPLSADERFAAYSPQPMYQSVELFKLTVPTEDLRNPEITSVPTMILGWDRIGPWVPWMKMGDHPGQLIYSGLGRKLSCFEELPQVLQDEINTHIPIYRAAPAKKEDIASVTSWTYFKEHFEAYLAGDRFPVV